MGVASHPWIWAHAPERLHVLCLQIPLPGGGLGTIRIFRSCFRVVVLRVIRLQRKRFSLGGLGRGTLLESSSKAKTSAAATSTGAEDMTCHSSNCAMVVNLVYYYVSIVSIVSQNHRTIHSAQGSYSTWSNWEIPSDSIIPEVDTLWQQHTLKSMTWFRTATWITGIETPAAAKFS